MEKKITSSTFQAKQPRRTPTILKRPRYKPVYTSNLRAFTISEAKKEEIRQNLLTANDHLAAHRFEQFIQKLREVGKQLIKLRDEHTYFHTENKQPLELMLFLKTYLPELEHQLTASRELVIAFNKISNEQAAPIYTNELIRNEGKRQLLTTSLKIPPKFKLPKGCFIQIPVSKKEENKAKNMDGGPGIALLDVKGNKNTTYITLDTKQELNKFLATTNHQLPVGSILGNLTLKKIKPTTELTSDFTLPASFTLTGRITIRSPKRRTTEPKQALTRAENGASIFPKDSRLPANTKIKGKPEQAGYRPLHFITETFILGQDLVVGEGTILEKMTLDTAVTLKEGSILRRGTRIPVAVTAEAGKIQAESFQSMQIYHGGIPHDPTEPRLSLTERITKHCGHYYLPNRIIRPDSLNQTDFVLTEEEEDTPYVELQADIMLSSDYTFPVGTIFEKGSKPSNQSVIPAGNKIEKNSLIVGQGYRRIIEDLTTDTRIYYLEGWNAYYRYFLNGVTDDNMNNMGQDGYTRIARLDERISQSFKETLTTNQKIAKWVLWFWRISFAISCMITTAAAIISLFLDPTFGPIIMGALVNPWVLLIVVGIACIKIIPGLKYIYDRFKNRSENLRSNWDEFKWFLQTMTPVISGLIYLLIPLCAYLGSLGLVAALAAGLAGGTGLTMNYRFGGVNEDFAKKMFGHGIHRLGHGFIHFVDEQGQKHALSPGRIKLMWLGLLGCTLLGVTFSALTHSTIVNVLVQFFGITTAMPVFTIIQNVLFIGVSAHGFLNPLVMPLTVFLYGTFLWTVAAQGISMVTMVFKAVAELLQEWQVNGWLAALTGKGDYKNKTTSRIIAEKLVSAIVLVILLPFAIYGSVSVANAAYPTLLSLTNSSFLAYCFTLITAIIQLPFLIRTTAFLGRFITSTVFDLGKWVYTALLCGTWHGLLRLIQRVIPSQSRAIHRHLINLKQHRDRLDTSREGLRDPDISLLAPENLGPAVVSDTLDNAFGNAILGLWGNIVTEAGKALTIFGTLSAFINSAAAIFIRDRERASSDNSNAANRHVQALTSNKGLSYTNPCQIATIQPIVEVIEKVAYDRGDEYSAGLFVDFKNNLNSKNKSTSLVINDADHSDNDDIVIRGGSAPVVKSSFF